MVNRSGIALPAVLLALVALAMLSSLALADGLQASRVAALAEDELRARAAVVGLDSLMRSPPDVVWLCLQPPAQPARLARVRADGTRIDVTWWMVESGLVRVQVSSRGPSGARHRRLAWMRPDSLVPLDPRPGCPEARGLIPAATSWRAAHPEG